MIQSTDDGALRYLDFTVIDIVIMQLCFILIYLASGHRGIIYADPGYRLQAIAFMSGQAALSLFSDVNYGVYTRDIFEEFKIMVRYTAEVWLLCGMFLLLNWISVNLVELLTVTLVYFDLAFFARILNKRRHASNIKEQRHVLVITTSGQARHAIEKINGSERDIEHTVTGLCLLDDVDPARFEDLEMPVMLASDPRFLETVSTWWIDDVFFLGTEETTYDRELMENFLTMGVTIHYSLDVLDSFAFAKAGVHSMGDYKAISNSIHFVSERSAFVKRAIDIAGGLAGTIMTGLIFLFVAPAIYIKSPGPIFFSQVRIGQNGKRFKIYKFRSMYMDAEKRKAELMAKNKIQDGLMFKMDDDPRIIGSEKKGKDGKPKGIGNFIRNTSLDEFPQFLNVLKGEMSLVGTRPPTVDEWNQYKLHHRARMSVKPGITGMWQVSGRSEITDFEKVVELDRQYLENWSVGLDFRILLKTVKVVLKHEGAV